MTATVLKKREMTITHITLTLPVRYEEEDIPNDFPLRQGDVWKATIEMDSGKILNWPKGKSGRLNMKVCDEGTYELGSDFGDHWERVAIIYNDYVPHGVVPGEYGDYVNLEIAEDGRITNWPEHPDVSEFFKNNED